MLTKEQIIEAIEAHVAAGCVFTMEYPGALGCAYARLSPETIASAILDLPNLPALLSGLTAEEYREWIESYGRVRCSGLTGRKRRCRNMVSGRMMSNPLEWKVLRDTHPCCNVHGGD